MTQKFPRLRDNNDAFVYKKSTIGQRDYKRSLPRFIAVSEQGICLKWNEDSNQESFVWTATRRLRQELECGLFWDVAVLYKTNPKHKIRKRVYFRVEFSLEDIELEKEWQLHILKRCELYKKARHRIMHSFNTGKLNTKKDLLQLIEQFPEYMKERKWKRKNPKRKGRPRGETQAK